MSARRFQCTACGLCCQGALPLTIDDALAGADLFPLAMMWQIVLPRDPSYALTCQLGAEVPVHKRKKIAILATSIAYIPDTMPCPALGGDKLCTIQHIKPLRCRTMPFYPYHEENQQAPFLTPRKGWACDTTENAPIIYENDIILNRTDFDAERKAHLQHAPALNRSITTMLHYNAALAARVAQIANKPNGGRFSISFFSFLRQQRIGDLLDFAQKQHPVLKRFEEVVQAQKAHSDYAAYYAQAAKELELFLKHSS